MKKRSYRALDVKQIGPEQIADIATKAAGRVVFGNDAAKDRWFGALMNGEGEVLRTVKWDVIDDRMRVLELLGELRRHDVKVEVGLESTGAYADAMAAQYRNAGIAVYRVSCKHTHDYSEIFDSVPSSHDAKSAAMVAELVLNGKAREWAVPDERQRDLKAAAQRLHWETEEETRHGNRLEALLARHWPELTRCIDITNVTPLVLLQKYGSPANVARDQLNARTLMKKTGKNFLAQETIESILAAARNTTGLPMSSQESALLQSLATYARQASQRVAEARAALEDLARGIESVRRTGAVVGVATAGVFAAMLGELDRYPCAKALLKAAGLNLKVRSSGKRAGQLTITKRGSGVVRRWLYMATLRWIQAEPIARAWYQSKLARNGGITFKAITALMRKLLAGLYHVARGGDLVLSKLFDLARLDISK